MLQSSNIIGIVTRGVEVTSVPMSRYSHETKRSAVIPADEAVPQCEDVSLEDTARRIDIERQDTTFIAQLRAAILMGFETPAGVLGQEYGPRRVRFATCAQSGCSKRLRVKGTGVRPSRIIPSASRN